MNLKVEIDSGDIGSHLATDFYEFAAVMRIIANWYQFGSFEEYQNSEQYVLLGKRFGHWLAENEYNFKNGHVVLIDFFEETVKAYKEEMKNA